MEIKINAGNCTFCNRRFSLSQLWQSGGGVLVCKKCEKNPEKRGIKLKEEVKP
jgi:hypothetical protein